MNRRDLLKKSALAGGAALWATPVVQTLGQGTAHALGSPTCTGCVNLTDLNPGNGVTQNAINVNTQLTRRCGVGCVRTTTYFWTVTNNVNCTFSVSAANLANSPTLDGTFTAPCAPGVSASARVSCQVTHRCANPNPPGVNFTDYTCTRIEDFFWPDCDTSPTSTLVSTTCPAGVGC